MLDVKNMIHFIKEGQRLHTGFNISAKMVHKGISLTFIWVSYEIATQKLKFSRFRFRSYMRPFFIVERREANVVDSYLSRHDLIAVPRELLEDQDPRLILLAQYFMQQFKSGVIGRYNG